MQPGAGALARPSVTARPRSGAMSGAAEARAAAEAAAEQVAASLEAIRRAMREAIWAQARRLPVSLTPQQVLALQLLVDQQRDTGGGLTLSGLAKRMGLAHSTVSGIVSRLEARKFVERTTDPQDRRFSRIELTAPVKDWVERELPATRLGPLADALNRATPQERAAILTGVETLERLVLRNRT